MSRQPAIISDQERNYERLEHDPLPLFQLQPEL
jgi:hypothetical protein